MAAVPELGRAAGIEPRVAPGAAATHDLYERYSRQIYAFCFQQLRNREEAEDAVQTTFLNAFRGLQRGISPEAESAWLYKIAHNVCLTRRRSSYRRGRVETPGDMQALQDFVAAPQRMGTDELIELQEALAAMPSTQRKAILLREWRGLSYREIADEMELSQAAVETLIFRARRSLANGLEQAPQDRKKLLKRLRHVVDLGTFVAAVKAALTGTAAVKAVATATAVSATVAAVSVVPSDERIPRRAHVDPAPAAARTPAPAPAERGSRALTPTDVVSVGAVVTRVERTQQPRKPVRHAKAAKPPVAKPASAPTPAPAAEAPAPPVADAPAPAPAPAAPQPEPRHEPKPAQPAAERPTAPQPEKAAPKAEQPKAEQPKAEQPKAEQPKAEQPKDQPKGGEPKPESLPRQTSGRPAAEPTDAAAPSAAKRGYEQKGKKDEPQAAPAAEAAKQEAKAADDAAKHEAQAAKKADAPAAESAAPSESRQGGPKADSPKTK